MDRMVYTALNSLKLLLETQTVSSTNLSNSTTIAFRKDTTAAFSSIYTEQKKNLTPRAFASIGQRSFNRNNGELIRTDAPFDIAINGDGWFSVIPESGEQALSRRGDLTRDLNNTLRTGDGSIILDVDGAPITLPDFREIEIGNDGMINIIPLLAGPEEFEFQEVARIGIYNADGIELAKGVDSFIRPVDENAVVPNDPSLRIKQGFLERSNVKPTDELVASIELARLYEVNVNLIKTAEQIDRSSSSLLRID
tara:strand:+ start:816 stop:1574 length:759 start_codon:yes stop_codon:yes gene_type:complete